MSVCEGVERNQLTGQRIYAREPERRLVCSLPSSALLNGGANPRVMLSLDGEDRPRSGEVILVRYVPRHEVNDASSGTHDEDILSGTEIRRSANALENDGECGERLRARIREVVLALLRSLVAECLRQEGNVRGFVLSDLGEAAADPKIVLSVGGNRESNSYGHTSRGSPPQRKPRHRTWREHRCRKRSQGARAWRRTAVR
jgi:hypothetical protein